MKLPSSLNCYGNPLVRYALRKIQDPRAVAVGLNSNTDIFPRNRHNWVHVICLDEYLLSCQALLSWWEEHRSILICVTLVCSSIFHRGNIILWSCNMKWSDENNYVMHIAWCWGYINSRGLFNWQRLIKKIRAWLCNTIRVKQWDIHVITVQSRMNGGVFKTAVQVIAWMSNCIP